MCGRIIIELDYFFQNVNTELITKFIHDTWAVKDQGSQKSCKNDNSKFKLELRGT